jgi:hypothetical protein
MRTEPKLLKTYQGSAKLARGARIAVHENPVNPAAIVRPVAAL